MSAVEARLAAMEARLAAVEARLNGASSPAPTSSKPIADDEDLDSQYGDAVVKKDPKRWVEQGGQSYEGCTMSQCPSDYLYEVAKLYDWQASKDEEQKRTYKNKKGVEVATAPFKRRDAARARGWAKRNAGHAHQNGGAETTSGRAGAEGSNGGGGDDDIPF